VSESAEVRAAMWRGILIGGVIGAMVGILLAPQEGDRTRRELKERVGELATAGAAIGGLLTDVAVDTASTMAQELGHVAERVKGAVGQGGGKIGQVLRTGGTTAREEMARLNAEYAALEGTPPAEPSHE
jgi:gas vesicle protein